MEGIAAFEFYYYLSCTPTHNGFIYSGVANAAYITQACDIP